MPSTCCIPGCKTNYQSSLKAGQISISTFKFPRDVCMKALWLDAIPRKDWQPSGNSVVCEVHFQEKDLIRLEKYPLPDGTYTYVPYFKTKLDPYAVPSRFCELPAKNLRHKKKIEVLPNDMENYMKFKIMGGLKQIRMKKDCVPTRFDCQPRRKGLSTSEVINVDDTEGASTSGIVKDPLETCEVDLDEPEYWYPDESDSLPESVNSGCNSESDGLKARLNPNANNPSYCEEYEKFLNDKIWKTKKISSEISNDKKDTRLSDLGNESRIIDPGIVKKEVEEIVIKEECEDIEDQSETHQEQQNFDYLDSVKTEGMEIGEVFFTPTYRYVGNNEEVESNNDLITSTSSISNNTTDDEATDTASETECYNEENRCIEGPKRIKLRQIVDEIELSDPLKTKRKPKNKLYKCQSCNFSTRNQPNLNTHIQNVHQKLTTKSFKCKHCNYNTDIERFLEKHVERLHSRPDKYKCEHCSHTTPTKVFLTQHVQSEHPEIKPIACKYCNFRTNRQGTLRNHIRCVHMKLKRYKCDKCDYESHHKPSLEHHISRSHLNMGKFQCEHCTYRTDYKTSLRKHKETAHVDLKKYKCDECEYRGRSQAAVEVHKYKAHLKVQKLKCERCSFETFCKEVLDTHKMVHNGDSLLQCDFCSYKSKYSSAIKRHVTIVHFKPLNL